VALCYRSFERLLNQCAVVSGLRQVRGPSVVFGEIAQTDRSTEMQLRLFIIKFYIMQNQSQIEPEAGSVLTSVQQQRYDSIYSVYGEISTFIVKALAGRGRNSWQTFLDKMDQVRRAKSVEREYFNALYETFELNLVYPPNEVVGYVAEVRRELELPPYIDKIKIRCEHDFFLVFVVEEAFEEIMVNGVIKKVLVGYRPIVRVKPA